MSNYVNAYVFVARSQANFSADRKGGYWENMTKVNSKNHRNIGMDFILDNIADSFDGHTAAFFKSPQNNTFDAISTAYLQ